MDQWRKLSDDDQLCCFLGGFFGLEVATHTVLGAKKLPVDISKPVSLAASAEWGFFCFDLRHDLNMSVYGLNVKLERAIEVNETQREIARLKAMAKKIDEEDAEKGTLEFYRSMSTREGRRRYDLGPFAVVEDWFLKLFRR